MSVIPQKTIDDLLAQYDADSSLWQSYPELEDERNGLILELMALDRPIIHQVSFQASRPVVGRKPIYLATAGAPLAGKSTILEKEMSDNPERYGHAVKVDPDRWGISLMANMYHGHLMAAGMLANAPDFETAQRRAYDIARPASNIFSHENLNEAAAQGYDIAHGTTMTGPHIRSLLCALKGKGYEIDLLLCSAEDDMRADAQDYRSKVQGYYQSTPEDVRSKGQAFPKKVQDYFELADNLALFWRSDVTGNAVKAAVYTEGQKIILDQAAYDSFVNKYEADRYALANPEGEAEPVFLPSFVEVEQLYLSRFGPDGTPKAGADSICPSPTPKL